MRSTVELVLSVFLLCALANAASVKQDPCAYFLRALAAVPHEKLTHSSGEHESLWDGKKYVGCEVKFVTHNNLLTGSKSAPSFEATEGTELYRNGWRMNNSLVADGPGTSIFGIEEDDVLCLVSRDQPAYVDEKSGKIIQSETLNIAVQCRQK